MNCQASFIFLRLNKVNGNRRRMQFQTVWSSLYVYKAVIQNLQQAYKHNKDAYFQHDVIL